MDERTVNDIAANAMNRPSVYVPALVDEITRLRAELAEYRRDAERLDRLEQMQQGVYPVTERVRVQTTTTEQRYVDEWRFIGWSVSGRLDELPTIRDAIDALAAKGE